MLFFGDAMTDRVNIKRLYYRLNEACTRMGCTADDVLQLASIGGVELVVHAPKKAHIVMSIFNGSNVERDRFDEVLRGAGIYPMMLYALSANTCSEIFAHGVTDAVLFNDAYAEYNGELVSYSSVFSHEFGKHTEIKDVKIEEFDFKTDRFLLFECCSFAGSLKNPHEVSFFDISKEEIFIRSAEIKRLENNESMELERQNRLKNIPNRTEWRDYAWAYGREYYLSNKKLSITQIAEKVCLRFKDDGIIGRGGNSLSAETIKRDALAGLKTHEHPKWERQTP